ncbi:hypothetical protein NDU88_005315 [Pleurodeles waltl]|uniref:Uncharacterized protein n=1 Tax=Pleurodeles waltl TaxID=8319 RepID=A0AAV7LTR6_PLEWA|nr:hypothetical protein NDU88_005315 [Pleurodeles waltl]
MRSPRLRPLRPHHEPGPASTALRARPATKLSRQPPQVPQSHSRQCRQDGRLQSEEMTLFGPPPGRAYGVVAILPDGRATPLPVAIKLHLGIFL